MPWIDHSSNWITAFRCTSMLGRCFLAGVYFGLPVCSYQYMYIVGPLCNPQHTCAQVCIGANFCSRLICTALQLLKLYNQSHFEKDLSSPLRNYCCTRWSKSSLLLFCMVDIWPAACKKQTYTSSMFFHVTILKDHP